jgi:hypothetical protein
MGKTSDIAEMLSWHSDTPGAAPTVCVELDDQVLTITDDLPHDAAINSSEIDAIERYMSDILDVVLGSGQAK